MVIRRFIDLFSMYRRLSCATDQNAKLKDSGPADFERAIVSTGYGKFNYLLLLAMLPAAFSSIFSSSAISYVLPSAECDLRLTMFDKGLLNAVSFAGMVCSSFLWGYIVDTFGRKRIMSYGYLISGLLNLATSFSHRSWLLIVCKFFDGIVLSGPYVALMSYLAEIHNKVHRSRSYMWLGVFFSFGNIFLPCIAWLILPQKWDITLFSETMKISSWRVFLAICSLPEFLASIAFFVFPESPRFLILKGRHDEALEIFKKIYSFNTGKDPNTYPIKSLGDEDPASSYEGDVNNKLYCWKQIKLLFLPPNIFKLIVISLIQIGATTGSNSLRLWMPQLFAMIENYKSTIMTDNSRGSGLQPSFCSVIKHENSHHSRPQLINETMSNVETACVPMELNSKVFINSIVIAVTGVIAYTLAGSLITVIGKKKLMAICFIVAATCCASLYWSEDTNGILGLSSVFIAMTSIGGAAIINFVVDNFPTSLRTMAVSLTMMMGRIGAMIGNLAFPILFELSCLAPFIMIGSVALVSAFLVALLPQKNLNNDKSDIA